jgi:hypothetical protein
MRIHQQLQLRLVKIATVLGTALALNCLNITPAKAETKFFDIILNSEGNQSFATLLQQAESSAKNFIQQGFAQKSSVTQVVVTVVGDRNGQQVPLLYTKVSRSDWQTTPQIHLWTKYFSSSAALLGFSKPQDSQATPRNSTVAVSAAKAKIGNDPAFRDD